MAQPFHIAIDGPVAAGKGTVSRLVADRLQFLYVDTGAMYRVVALVGQRNDVDLKDEAALVELLKKTDIQMHNPTAEEKDGRLTTVLINGEDVSWAIRTEQVSKGASIVAAHPDVRKVLVEKQQIIAQAQDVVMEGRDITYRVLPDAQLKIYLTAGDTVRAKRRHMQLLTKGQDVPFQDVYTELLKRDAQDMSRKTDPLKITDDAWQIDTSDLAIEQVVELIVGKVQVLRE
jgi:cytidylate kinase